MVYQKMTPAEIEAKTMLLGENWSYGYASHTFMRAEPRPDKALGMVWSIAEYRCADTFEPITSLEAQRRRVEIRQRDKDEIDAFIRTKGPRTHAASEDES